MEKKLECKDVGLDCVSSFCAEREKEVIREACEHIQSVHGMKGFSREIYRKVRAVIHEGSCESGAKDIS